ncbi:MAG: phosphate acetyltransferase [Christensenellaceae bacterium]|jgi:phosphate acetyltransferase|nr:phosphate acetyltransferase [Christensenellaceae bacterium]
MSKFMDATIASAKILYKHIVLPEGEEPRVIAAAFATVKEHIAKITLLGDKTKISETAKSLGITNLSGIEIVDPSSSIKRNAYSKLLYDLRKDKGVSEEEAKSLTLNPLYYGCLMIKSGDADGMVAGSINSTGDVLRPALQIIKSKKGIKTVSSCFVMVLPDSSPYGENSVMIFGDCAVLPNPTADQLVDIAFASVDSALNIGKIKDPKVALLSFSTMGSAKHELVNKVKDALSSLLKLNPKFAVDGELQLDAAIVPEVARLKAPGSLVAGKANVLIFPDLQSGNIGYKLVQRFGSAEAIGPICQGLASPVNDLSRGCNVNDIISVIAITALQTA